MYSVVWRAFGEMWSVTYGPMRWVAVAAIAMIFGCSSLTESRLPPQEPIYSLTGRLRISADQTILRLDFRFIAATEASYFKFWGPLGVRYGEAKVTENQIEFVARNGDRFVLGDPELNEILPNGAWLLGIDWGNWLRLLPEGTDRVKSLEGWQAHDTTVRVVAHQEVDQEKVCKRLDVSRSDIKLVVLCDRWMLANK